jgi:inorganic triphosphatase YgiF
MTSPTEIEIKLELPSAKPLRIAEVPAVRQTSRAVRSERLVSIYFDTDRLKLGRHGVTLRVRHVGRRHIQTIKTGDGLFERGEWETPVASDHPDLKAARRTPIKGLLTRKARQQLHAVFETRVRRRTYSLRTKTADIALAIDRGEIDTGKSKLPLHEIELELERGDKAELFELARTLVRLTSAELAVKSKSERGYELIEDSLNAVARAESLNLPKRASTADAFRLIAGSCLKQIVANKPAVCAKKADGIHQMRVGLRRLRAALSLFKEMLPAESTLHIKDELKWLTGELAPARELEVLLGSVVAPMAKRGGKTANGNAVDGKAAGIASLSRELRQERRSARQRAADAAASPRFRDLMIDLAGWIEVGAWQHADPLLRERASEPVATTARLELERRWKRLRKRGRALATLEPQRRHKLRIQAKKLRYAAEFFASVFGGKDRARCYKAFVRTLHELQDRLGELNDIAVHENRSTAVAEASAARARVQPHRAFAAGLVVGHEEARLQIVLEAAERACEGFRKAKPFW